MSRLIQKVRGAWRGRRQRRFHARLRRLGVEIGPGCHIWIGSQIFSGTVIGEGTRINGPAIFKGSQPIIVGRYCAIGDGVRMISSNHDTDHANMNVVLQTRLGLGGLDTARGPIIVGHNVWIGDAAIILTGVTVGSGAVIGAGSVVTKDVPAFAVVAGAPARLIRMRFSEAEADRLSELAWWDWSEERMQESRDLFEADLTSGNGVALLHGFRQDDRR